MFGNLNVTPSSLNDFSAYLMEEHQLSVSKQSIDDRFNDQAVVFLRGLLEEEMSKRIDYSSIRSLSAQFSSIRLKDSTKWNLPDHCAHKYKGHGGCRGNSKSMISVQFEYDLLSGVFKDLSLTSGTRNDQKDAKEVKDNIPPKELLIRDLGYASGIEYMENIAAKGAFFLNRMSPQVAVFNPEDQKEIDFNALRNKLKKNNLPYIEQSVEIGSKQHFGCRMVITRVPDEVYQKRIRDAEKIAKKRGYKVTNSYKARAALNIFLTNASCELLKAADISKVYRIRWQIELIFKVWKSLGKINAYWKMKVPRFECQLIAKLIWIVINWKVFLAINHWLHQLNPKNLCSIWKFYKQVIRLSMQLRDILWKKASLESWLFMLFSKAERNLTVEKKKNKLASWEILNILIP